jgi:hypothetical protein
MTEHFVKSEKIEKNNWNGKQVAVRREHFKKCVKWEIFLDTYEEAAKLLTGKMLARVCNGEDGTDNNN